MLIEFSKFLYLLFAEGYLKQDCHIQGKNSGERKNSQIREFPFQSGKFRKMKKSHGKVMEFQNFPRKLLDNSLLEILFSEIAGTIRKGIFLNINCKQFMLRNIPFLIFMV